MKWFKYTLLGYVILFLVIASYSMRERSCISSSIVKEIDINHPGNPVQIPNCYGSKSLGGIMVLGDQKLLKLIQKQVNYLEDAISNNRLFVPYKKIKIVINSNGNYEVDSNKVVMPISIATSDISLERALTRAWLLNFSSQDVRSDKFLQTIFSDIYIYLFWNKKIINSDDVKTNWLKYFYSEKDICKSKLMPPDQNIFCETIGMSPKNKEFQKISIWSLRPFILAQFYEFYDNLSIKEKTQSFQILSRVVSNTSWKESYDNLDFKKISSIYSKLIKMILPKDDASPLVTLIPGAVIEGSKTASLVTEEKIPQNSLILKSKNEYWNLANQSLIDLDKVEAKKWFTFEKKLPKLSDLKNLDAQTVTVFVRGQNPLVVHIPSLQLLARYHHPEILDLNINEALKSRAIQQILGWNPVQVY